MLLAISSILSSALIAFGSRGRRIWRAYMRSARGIRVRAPSASNSPRPRISIRLFSWSEIAASALTRIPRADLMYARQIRRPRDPDAPSLRDLMDKIDALAKEIPEEEWEKLPTDLSERHDYYIHGGE